MKHLLSASDLSRDAATAILDDADKFAEALLGRDVKKLPTLRGRTVITMFYENSTRTRVSFEVAGKWMSADVINVSASGSSVAKGESLRDTALTLRAAGAVPAATAPLPSPLPRRAPPTTRTTTRRKASRRATTTPRAPKVCAAHHCRRAPHCADRATSQASSRRSSKTTR